MTGAVRLEILSSLASVREDVERHVAKLDRYRALKSIERTIADFPALDDLNRALSELRDGMQRQLSETREVRALRAVEKIMPELSKVLTFLTERMEKPSIVDTEIDREPDAGSSALSSELAEDEDRPQSSKVTVVIATPMDGSDGPNVPQATSATYHEARSATLSEPRISENVDPGESPMPANDAGDLGDTGSPAKPTISYGIAQFLSPDEPAALAAGEARHDDELPSQLRVAPSQEGRAA